MSPPLAICAALAIVVVVLAVVAKTPDAAPIPVYLSPAAHKSLASQTEGKAGRDGKPLTVTGLIEEFAARPR